MNEPVKCEDVIMPFGKHKGRALGDILASDAAYLDWLAGTEIRSTRLAGAVKEMVGKYTPEIERALASRSRQ